MRNGVAAFRESFVCGSVNGRRMALEMTIDQMRSAAEEIVPVQMEDSGSE